MPPIPYTPVTDIWWWSLDICSNMFTWETTRPSHHWHWHLVLVTEAGILLECCFIWMILMLPGHEGFGFITSASIMMSPPCVSFSSGGGPSRLTLKGLSSAGRRPRCRGCGVLLAGCCGLPATLPCGGRCTTCTGRLAPGPEGKREILFARNIFEKILRLKVSLTESKINYSHCVQRLP